MSEITPATQAKIDFYLSHIEALVDIDPEYTIELLSKFNEGVEEITTDSDYKTQLPRFFNVASKIQEAFTKEELHEGFEALELRYRFTEENSKEQKAVLESAKNFQKDFIKSGYLNKAFDSVQFQYYHYNSLEDKTEKDIEEQKAVAASANEIREHYEKDGHIAAATDVAKWQFNMYKYMGNDAGMAEVTEYVTQLDTTR